MVRFAATQRAEVVADRAVVASDQLERPRCQRLPFDEMHAALMRMHAIEDVAIIETTRRYRDTLEVFRGGADHARATDVDVLDGLGFGHTGFRHRLLERVQVAHHQVDFRQRVVRERLHVFRLVALGQQAGEDRGVK